jgi:hypothetical protein
MLKHPFLKHFLCAAATATLMAGPALAKGVTAALGSKWEDAAKMPDFFTGVWQSRAPMVDGKVNVELTPAAKAFAASYKPAKDIPLAGAGCKTPGMPIVQRSGSPLAFTYRPGMISIYIEQASMTRFIRMNQKHTEDPNPTFLGESVGHWEGDTLVVDSIGFRDDILFQYGVINPNLRPFEAPSGEGATFLSNVIFGPHGPNLRMVERFRMTDKNTLEQKLTIHDDTVFTGPYPAPTHIYKRETGASGWPGEWQCDVTAIMTYDPATNTSSSLNPEEALKRYEEGSLK